MSPKRRVREKDNFERYVALDHLKIVASRRSADVLEAAEIILNNPVQNSDSEKFMSHASILGMVTGILTDVARNPDYIQDAIWMLKRLALKENVEGIYVDTNPDNALKEIVSYDVGKYVQFQEIAVENITKWKGENAEAYALAVRSIQPVLNRAVGFTRSYGATVTFGSAQLAASPSVIALREKVQGFIQDALKSGIRNVQVAALEVCSEIGSLGKGPGPPEGSAGKITEIIENERFGILEVLQELIEQKAVGLDLTARIERLLWDWWWSKTEKISSKCLEIIKKIDATSNYNLYKLLYIDDCPVMADLAVAGKLQASEDRRKFYFRSKDRREGKKFIEQTISAVGDLSNNEHWAQVIDDCGKEAGREASSWSYGNVLHYLAEQNPTLAYSLYAHKKDKPWDKYGSILLTGARSGNPDTWAEFLRPISENVTNSEVSSLCDCIQAINEDDLSTQEIVFLKKCAKQPSGEVRFAVANKVGRIGKRSWPIAEELSGKLVENPVSQEILDSICSALIHNRPDGFKRNPTATEGRILNAFKDIEEIKKYWCLDYVARFSLDDPTILFNLIEQIGKKGGGLYSFKEVFKKVASDWEKRDDFKELFNRVASWIDNGVQLDYLTQKALEYFSGKKAIQILEDSLSEETPASVKRAAAIASNFIKNEDFFDFFTDLLEKAAVFGDDVFQEVFSCFQGSLMVGAFQRAIGQPSDRDMNIKNQCERILGTRELSPKVRRYFEVVIRNADASIDNDLKGDEEMFED